jgi:hypothetical protein
MSNAFSGNLAQLKLMDVLRLLHASNRTGILELVHEDGRQGEIYFDNGQIIHAVYEDAIGEDAVYGLFSWASGTFSFTATDTSPTDERTTYLQTEEILLECVTYATEWESVRRVVPSSRAVFRLSSRPMREFSLRAEDWSVIQNLDGVRTVSEIGDLTQLNELMASKVIVRLYDLGLVEFVGERQEDSIPVETVSEDILHQTERELTRAIGPMAPIVLEDCAEGLGYKLRQLPKDMMPSLAERLAEEIPDNERRVKFQEAMLEIMQHLYA